MILRYDKTLTFEGRSLLNTCTCSSHHEHMFDCIFCLCLCVLLTMSLNSGQVKVDYPFTRNGNFYFKFNCTFTNHINILYFKDKKWNNMHSSLKTNKETKWLNEDLIEMRKTDKQTDGNYHLIIWKYVWTCKLVWEQESHEMHFDINVKCWYNC